MNSGSSDMLFIPLCGTIVTILLSARCGISYSTLGGYIVSKAVQYYYHYHINLEIRKKMLEETISTREKFVNHLCDHGSVSSIFGSLMNEYYRWRENGWIHCSEVENALIRDKLEYERKSSIIGGYRMVDSNHDDFESLKIHCLYLLKDIAYIMFLVVCAAIFTFFIRTLKRFIDYLEELNHGEAIHIIKK